MAERPVLFLIDGHAVAYRQFFALASPNFSTRAGEPTNATYGFTRILLDIIQKDKPHYLAVCFDRGLSGRGEMYPEYKGTREKMPDELRIQIDRIHEVVEAFNIPILAVDGYEADDVIGTIAVQAEEQGVDVRIITGDRDILQLLTSHVFVQLPKRGEADVVYDIEMFQKMYNGLEPEQLIDLKALMGDSSDNIPGVKGIGEKGGTKLLQTYETLENIYENIDSIKGATQKKLITDKEMAFLSQKLATIQKDVAISLELEACVAQDYDAEKVDTLFAELEFRGFRDRLTKKAEQENEQLPLFAIGSDANDAEGEIEADVVPFVIVQDQAGLDSLVEKLNNASGITFDVETTSVDQMSARLVGIALAVDSDEGFYIPVAHEEGEQLSLDLVIHALREPLTNPDIPKYAHNAVYDLVVMQRYGIDVQPIAFDTMIAEWVRDPVSRFLGLKRLVLQELNVRMTDIGELLGTGRKQLTMDKVSVEQAAPYAAADAALTMRLVDFLDDQLKQNTLADLFHTLEMPLVPVLADIQRTGVLIDKEFLTEMSERLGTEIHRIQSEIYDLSGGYGAFNISSPKQLNDVLFGKLALPVEGLRKTSHGYSTDVVTLEILKDKHAIVPLILEYREYTKLKSTYVDALPTLVNAETGRVHTSYNQTGTATGRISSNNPNLQNIPIRTELGREVRRGFIAPEGKMLLAVDYSQIELRVMAHMSQDVTLIEAFLQGQDIHSATAAAVFGIAPDDVTYEQRSFAKRVNFGLMYGMGAFRLARDSELTLAEADEFIKTYFEQMPGVQNYIEGTKKFAIENGYTETLFGRKRQFKALQKSGWQRAIGAS